MSETPAAPRRLTLEQGMRGSRNSLGVIRLVLASAVIFSHAFYLGSWGEDPTHEWTNGQETIGGFAVVGFFIVSGYLITLSGMRTDILQFMWHRSLRIFPAFLVVLAVGAVLVGPAVWADMGRPMAEYWTTAPEGPLTYVTSNARLDIFQWGIHDIFVGTTPYGGAFNGSLWTLAYEWRAYLIIAALVLAGALKRLPSVVVIAAGIAYAINVLAAVKPDAVGAYVPEFGSYQTRTLTLAFLIGGAFAVMHRRVTLDGRLAAFAGLVAAVTLVTDGWVLVGYLALAYVLFFAAARLPESWRRIGARNDYSYGMYVYGFLVQQTTAYLGWYHWGYIPWVAVTLAITAACAYLSWHLVERRALSAKKRGPGRGIAYWVDWTRSRIASLTSARSTTEGASAPHA